MTTATWARRGVTKLIVPDTTGGARVPDGTPLRADCVSGIGWIGTLTASCPLGPNITTGNPATTGRTVFVFPGHGSQWEGMVVELLVSAPEFADQMKLCDAVFAEFVDWSLLEAVRGSVDFRSLDLLDVVQPALFAVMVSLAAQWRALGIHPDAVLGQSLGEVAAAYVAGALSLRDAAMVVTSRSKAVSAAAAHCERDGLPATQIPVDYAAHSPAAATLRDNLREQLSGLQPRTGGIAFISTVTGAALDASILDGEYWFANLRQPALFDHALRWAYEHGYRTFIESSPYPVLTACIRESLEEFDIDSKEH